MACASITDSPVAVGLEVPPFHREWDTSGNVAVPDDLATFLWRLSGPWDSPVWWHTTLTVWDVDGDVDPEADEAPSYDLRQKLTFGDLRTAAASLYPSKCALVWDATTLTLAVTERDGSRRRLVACPLSADQSRLAEVLQDARRRVAGAEHDVTAASEASEFTDTVARVAADLIDAAEAHHLRATLVREADHDDGGFTDYDLVLDVVHEVDTHRHALESLTVPHRQALLNLSGAWTGTTADLFAVAGDLGLLPPCG